MPVFLRFEHLDNEAHFVEVVCTHLRDAWTEVTAPVGLTPAVDAERAKLAFGAYTQTLKEITKLLHSQNPDHYKRAAALLDALNRTEVITDLELDGPTLESLEDNTALGLSVDDCKFRLKFVRFYSEYCNQLMAFDLAFRCCAAYEKTDIPYNPNYLENMCHYLKEHAHPNVDALYMIFKSYWFSG
ncbi:MAG: hypothetical protein ABSA90_01715 [Xanthobacteraceae bacterium]|jgi:hypothetical protein